MYKLLERFPITFWCYQHYYRRFSWQWKHSLCCTFLLMPRCEGRPGGPCPNKVNNSTVTLTQRELMFGLRCLSFSFNLSTVYSIDGIIHASQWSWAAPGFCGLGAAWGQSQEHIGGRANGNKAYVLGTWGHVGAARRQGRGHRELLPLPPRYRYPCQWYSTLTV